MSHSRRKDTDIETISRALIKIHLLAGDAVDWLLRVILAQFNGMYERGHLSHLSTSISGFRPKLLTAVGSGRMGQSRLYYCPLLIFTPL